mgnify:FL=1
MNSLNAILLQGVLVRNPEVHESPNGVMVCTFTVASDRFYRDEGSTELEKEVSLFVIEAWWRLGQCCVEKLKKGRGVRVVGRLKQERWVDGEGKNKSKVKIVAEHVEFKPAFNRAPEEDDA